VCQAGKPYLRARQDSYLRFLTYGSSHPLQRPNRCRQKTTDADRFSHGCSAPFVLGRNRRGRLCRRQRQHEETAMTGNRNMQNGRGPVALTQVLQRPADDAKRRCGLNAHHAFGQRTNGYAPLRSGPSVRDRRIQISRISATRVAPLGGDADCRRCGSLDARAKNKCTAPYRC